MIEAIFCDLDGVLRHWDNSALFALEQQHDLPQGYLFRHAFQPAHVQPAITGKCSHQKWVDGVARAMREDVGAALAQDLCQAWQQSSFRIDEVLLTFLQQQAVPLYLVTNATDRLEADMAQTLVGDSMHVINSSVISVAKPAQEFYAVMLERAKVAARAALFIDDSLKNCQAAQALAIQVVHHHKREDTVQRVQEFMRG